MESLTLQVGGTHYKGLKYQPALLAARADLNFFQANIIKYVTRFKDKDGLQDLRKVIHYAYIGDDLEPKNHVGHNGIKELVQFVRDNELTPDIGNICYQAVHQNWMSVITHTRLLIEQEYGADALPK